MSCGATKINKPPFSQHNNAVTVRKGVLVNLWLNNVFHNTREIIESFHLDFNIEVADITNNRIVLHCFHMLDANDVSTTCRGYKNIAFFYGFFHCSYFITFHRCLQGANRVDFGNDNSCAETAHGVCTALAYVPIPSNDNDFSRNHDIGGAFDSVCQ